MKYNVLTGVACYFKNLLLFRNIRIYNALIQRNTGHIFTIELPDGTKVRKCFKPDTAKSCLKLYDVVEETATSIFIEIDNTTPLWLQGLALENSYNYIVRRCIK